MQKNKNFSGGNIMEELRADITEFIAKVLTTILGFFNGTENELTEEQYAGIESFVNFIFMQ